MKHVFILFFLVVCFFSQSFLSFSRGMVVYPISDPQEVNVPRNLRTPRQFSKRPFFFNFLGLQNLRVSGSGQFSEKNFIEMTHSLPIAYHKLMIVDLREESHGFVNGNAVSWTDGIYNYGNLHKTKMEIESDEFQRLRLAAQAKQLVLNPLGQPLKLPVHNVRTEREIVESYGLTYIRLPVTDHNRPTNEVIDQFVELVKNLLPDQWMHLHCRAGKGRTTTFLVFFDIMQNARYVSLRDILFRQKLIGGADLAATHKKYGEKRRAASERLRLIHSFYLYCQQVPDFQIPWSDWVKRQCLLVNHHP